MNESFVYISKCNIMFTYKNNILVYRKVLFCSCYSSFNWKWGGASGKAPPTQRSVTHTCPPALLLCSVPSSPRWQVKWCRTGWAFPGQPEHQRRGRREQARARSPQSWCCSPDRSALCCRQKSRWGRCWWCHKSTSAASGWSPPPNEKAGDAFSNL